MRDIDALLFVPLTYIIRMRYATSSLQIDSGTLSLELSLIDLQLLVESVASKFHLQVC